MPELAPDVYLELHKRGLLSDAALRERLTGASHTAAAVDAFLHDAGRARERWRELEAGRRIPAPAPARWRPEPVELHVWGALGADEAADQLRRLGYGSDAVALLLALGGAEAGELARAQEAAAIAAAVTGLRARA